MSKPCFSLSWYSPWGTHHHNTAWPQIPAGGTVPSSHTRDSDGLSKFTLLLCAHQEDSRMQKRGQNCARRSHRLPAKTCQDAQPSSSRQPGEKGWPLTCSADNTSQTILFWKQLGLDKQKLTAYLTHRKCTRLPPCHYEALGEALAHSSACSSRKYRTNLNTVSDKSSKITI